MDDSTTALKGRVALVTGAASGLGRATALALAEAGATVVLTELPDRLAAAEETARAAARDYGAETLTVPLDLTNLETIGAMVSRTLERFGRIDILVNNAGINIPKMALDVTEEDWDRVLDVNLKGLFFTSQAVGREMIARGGGKIINIASQMGVVGYYKRAAYCSSKAGVVNLTRVLAIEWAPHGIRVNCIGPTILDTPLTGRCSRTTPSARTCSAASRSGGSASRRTSSARSSTSPRPPPTWSAATRCWSTAAGRRGEVRSTNDSTFR